MHATTKLLQRAFEIERELAKIKPLYSELDEIKRELARRKFKALTVKGTTFLLIDKFNSSQTAFKTVAFHQYELLIEPRK